MHFEKLKLREDYEAVIELVYQTDPYLYPDLFGSLENAKKIMPFLLDDKKSTWFKDYIYTVKNNSEIIGIVTILPYNVEWNFNAIRIAYMEAGMQITARVRAACDYFADSFTRIGKGASACNICVREDHRGKGIGRFLLEKVIEMAGANNIELTVLANNISAVRLYQNHGFLIIKELYDYGGYNQPKVLCYSMVRIGDKIQIV